MPLEKNFSKEASNLLELMGVTYMREGRENLLGQKLPEISLNAPHDLP
jgi:hypothetical protein